MPQPKPKTAKPQTVYIVSNGLGGRINSAWTSRSKARERVNTLNRDATFTLAYGVTTTTLNS